MKGHGKIKKAEDEEEKVKKRESGNEVGTMT